MTISPQTAREKAPDSFTKAVLATYRLPDGNFVLFHGRTHDVGRQALFVTAAHYMRLKRWLEGWPPNGSRACR